MFVYFEMQTNSVIKHMFYLRLSKHSKKHFMPLTDPAMVHTWFGMLITYDFLSSSPSSPIVELSAISDKQIQ